MSNSDQKPRPQSSRPNATVIYAEVNRKKREVSSPKMETFDTTVASSSVFDDRNRSIRSIETSTQTCDGESLLFLETPEQVNTYNQNNTTAGISQRSPTESKTTKSKSRTASPSCDSKQEVSYRVRSCDSSLANNQLDSQSLILNYKEAPPYGASGQGNVENNRLPKFEQSNRVETSSQIGCSSSSPFYSSLLHTSNAGAYTVRVSSKGMSYVDFMPQERKESCCKTEYLNFADCLKQANNWLAVNRGADVWRCETIRHRLDNSHKFNPESMAADDRSYLIGLRLWFKLAKKENENAIRLAYRNFIPQYLEREKTKSFHSADRPYFEDFSTTIKRMNDSLIKEPIPGVLIDVETIPVNLEMIHHSGESTDFDACYCSFDHQGEWEIFMIRIFYVVDSRLRFCPRLDCVDFSPEPFSLPPSTAQFQTMSALVKNANIWLEKNRSKQLFATNLVDFPFRMSMLVASKGHINTNISSCKPSKSSANKHSLKVLRLWVSDQEEIDTACRPDPISGFDLISFAPQQFTTSGCCGANKALFANNREVVEKINEWLHCSGAELIDVQTDSIEKWQKSSFSVHSILPERTYNKEDYSSSLRSALECRITVLRVYYRPNNLGHFYSPGPDNPLKPCCCFVGCNVM